MGIEKYFDCVRQFDERNASRVNVNVTQMLALLPKQIQEDKDLNATIKDCINLGMKPNYAPLWGQYSWFVVFGVMLLLAFVGNFLVIWIGLAYREMRTVTNSFLVNLAVADLLMATLYGAPFGTFLITMNWPFSSAACRATNFISNLTVSAGIFTLVAITADRYMAIVKPLHHRLNKRIVKRTILTLWCSSILLALPTLIYSEIYTEKYLDGERVICSIKWPDGMYPTSKIDYAYNIIFVSLTYVLPVAVMVPAYYKISTVLHGKSIGEFTQNQSQLIQSKRKVIRMFVIVVVVFTLCWLPYHMYFLLAYHFQWIMTAPFMQHVYLGTYWLAMANSLFNPIIYYYLSTKGRVYFQMVTNCLRVRKSTNADNSHNDIEMQVFSMNRGHVHGALCEGAKNSNRGRNLFRSGLFNAEDPNLLRNAKGNKMALIPEGEEVDDVNDDGICEAVL